MAENTEGQAGTQQQFALQRIYIKDLSFEVPLGAAAYDRPWKPTVQVELNTSASPVDANRHEVVLTITLKAKLEEEVAFLIELQQAGVFIVRGVDGEQLPGELLAKPHIYPKDLGPTVMRDLTRRFRDALAPLDDAGALGVVLFQFPVWFPISAERKAELERIRDDFADLRVAIELRNETWMSQDNRHDTLELLADNDLIYVCVDEPQGFVASIPPVVAATSDTAVVRMHGRNPARWRDRPTCWFSTSRPTTSTSKPSTCSRR